MKYISGFILWLIRWKVTGSVPPHIKKCVIIAAPHTSNWDFVIGRLAYWKLGVPVRFLIKREAFDHPLGGLVKALGGIPVDRKKSNNLVEQVAEMFDHYDVLNVIITPEGTRRLVTEWKRGFYYIALRANVPIVIGFIDYKRRVGGFGPVIYPTGDFDVDFKIIQDFYKDKTARHPEKFNLSPMYQTGVQEA
ncbi:MAG: 1-acyl-sn-glycerol-3-phosphate acyltransferase [Bacteroidetes bacterium]|nr:1-acyl-sn-glycerol-3-phosphate acyltransferase [Bacteroidota bacterium]